MNVLLVDFGVLAAAAPSSAAGAVSAAAQTSATTAANRPLRRALEPIVVHEGIFFPFQQQDSSACVMHSNPTFVCPDQPPAPANVDGPQLGLVTLRAGSLAARGGRRAH